MSGTERILGEKQIPDLKDLLPKDRRKKQKKGKQKFNKQRGVKEEATENQKGGELVAKEKSGVSERGRSQSRI